MGTFSRMLLPSIRMSFMVLPPELLSVYQKRGEFYNQTASKAEQIALCQFIRDGHLEAQIRKSRRLYLQKAKLCAKIFRNCLEKRQKHIQEKRASWFWQSFRQELSGEEIRREAEKAGVGVRTVDEKEWNREFPSSGSSPDSAETAMGLPIRRILLSCASVPAEHYKEALLRLKQSLGMQLQ